MASTEQTVSPAQAIVDERVAELAEQGRAYGLKGLYDLAAEYAAEGEWDIATRYLTATALVLAENAHVG